MTRPLLFVHGWGYDRTVWDAIASLLPDRPMARVEAGYFGSELHWPVMAAGTILVGHSAGVLASLRRGLLADCAGLVSINGFSRFSAAEGFPGVPERVLARMEQGLAASEGDVLTTFRRRCGDLAPVPERADVTALAVGLDSLRRDDARAALQAASVPVLALAAFDDPIVSAAHTRACFAEEHTGWSDTGGHLLPLSRPDWCAAMIGTFAC